MLTAALAVSGGVALASRLEQVATRAAYRQIVPVSLRGSTLAANSFQPINRTLPPVNTAVTTSDQKVTLSLPAGIATGSSGQPVSVRLQVAPAAAPETDRVAVVSAITINMAREDGSPVTQLAQPMDIELRFSAADLARAGIDPTAMEIQYSNDGLVWRSSPTTIDTRTGIARTTVTHLTTFALIGRRTPPGPTIAPPPPTPTSGAGTATPGVSPTMTPLRTPTPSFSGGFFFPFPGGGGGGGTAPTATSTRTSTPTVTPTPANPRGVIITNSTGDSAIDNVLSKSGAGGWFNFRSPSAGGPAGKVQLLRVGPNALPASYDATLQAIAQARPGSYWIVGNEPNTPGQDKTSGAQYAADFTRYRNAIRAADPTARFVVGNTLNFDLPCRGCSTDDFQTGRGFLNDFLAAHGALPGDTLWGIHTYLLDWSYPGGLQRPMVDAAALQGDLSAFNAFARARANRPIWVTEFGVIWGFQDYCGFAPINSCGMTSLHPDVTTFFRSMLGFFASSGYERWFVYTNYGSPEPYASVYAGISLMTGPDAGAGLTSFGRIFAGLE